MMKFYKTVLFQKYQKKILFGNTRLLNSGLILARQRPEMSTKEISKSNILIQLLGRSSQSVTSDLCPVKNV
jgi:hypothetical protein